MPLFGSHRKRSHCLLFGPEPERFKRPLITSFLSGRRRRSLHRLHPITWGKTNKKPRSSRCPSWFMIPRAGLPSFKRCREPARLAGLVMLTTNLRSVRIRVSKRPPQLPPTKCRGLAELNLSSTPSTKRIVGTPLAFPSTFPRAFLLSPFLPSLSLTHPLHTFFPHFFLFPSLFTNPPSTFFPPITFTSRQPAVLQGGALGDGSASAWGQIRPWWLPVRRAGSPPNIASG